MMIWTFSDIVSLVLISLLIVYFIGLGMLYFVAFMLDKLSKWREKRWEQRHGRK